jgi:hypothetical protein
MSGSRITTNTACCNHHRMGSSSSSKSVAVTSCRPSTRVTTLEVKVAQRSPTNHPRKNYARYIKERLNLRLSLTTVRVSAEVPVAVVVRGAASDTTRALIMQPAKIMNEHGLYIY